MSVGPSTSGFVLCKTPNSGGRRGQQRALRRDGQRAQLTAMSSPPFVEVSNTTSRSTIPIRSRSRALVLMLAAAARSAGSRIMYSSSVAARSRPGGRGGSGLAKLDVFPSPPRGLVDGRGVLSGLHTPSPYLPLHRSSSPSESWTRSRLITGVSSPGSAPDVGFRAYGLHAMASK